MHTKPAFTETKFIVTIIFVTSLFMRWGIPLGCTEPAFSNVLKSDWPPFTALLMLIFFQYYVSNYFQSLIKKPGPHSSSFIVMGVCRRGGVSTVKGLVF